MNEDKFFKVIVIILTTLLIIISISMVINFEKENTLSTLLSTLATSLAAFASYMGAKAASYSTKISQIALENQLNEFIINIKPELILLNKDFTIEYPDGNKPPHLYNWETQDFDLEDRLFANHVTIPIVNVGKGFAKNIEISWEFTLFEEAISNLKEQKPYSNLYKEFKFEVKKLRKYNGIKGLEIFSDFMYQSELGAKISRSEYRIEMLDIERIPFLQPGSSANICIPPVFIMFYNILFINYPLQVAKVDIHPNLHLTLKYSDIDNRNYESKFSIDSIKMSISHDFARQRRAELTLINN